MVRRQYALDATISDWVLARGYAFAATDKGNTGAQFYRDGSQPGDAVAEWNRRVTELTVAAKAAVRQRYGRGPERTYLTGISNGGYLVRWQLENRAFLYDGGVDLEGTLFRADGPNLFTYLPAALRSYPAYKAGSQAAHDAMLAAGFAPGRSSCGTSTTRSTGTSPSGSTARSSTRRTTARPRPVRRSVPAVRRPVTPTTTTSPGPPRSGRRSRRSS